MSLSAGVFKIWTNDAGFRSPSGLDLFESRTFVVQPGIDCSDAIRGHLIAHMTPDSRPLRISILEIEIYIPEIVQVLKKALIGFPSDLLESVEYNSSTGQNIAVLPRMHRNSHGESAPST